MRFVFLIPDYAPGLILRGRRFLQGTPARGLVAKTRDMRVAKVFGGSLNIIRHCLAARNAGADAVIATERGVDDHGFVSDIAKLPIIRWKDRNPEDVCLVPDMLTRLINSHPGPCISYQQSPKQIKHDYDYQRDNVRIWTDSELMLALCQKAYPGIDIPIVPNIVDHRAFPWVPQAQRQQGELIAFPRKEPEFIGAAYRLYQEKGGRYWRLNLVDGLPFTELAKRFRTPQAFLASGAVEGCALPPQECMAAGIVVIGRSANGANFCMQDERTALVAETPEQAAEALLRAEDAELREQLTKNGYAFIQRYFDTGEPHLFWKQVIQSFGPRQAG